MLYSEKSRFIISALFSYTSVAAFQRLALFRTNVHLISLLFVCIEMR